MAETLRSLDELNLHLTVLRCQAGDRRAFVQLFNRFEPRTLEYLRALLGDAAEDVNQEVWIAVYRGLRSLADPGSFRTWLFRSARHRAIDHMRRAKRERELFNTAMTESAGSLDCHTAHSAKELRRAEIEGVLSQLAPAQREVLLLRYIDGLSYAECALVVGCSIGTIRSRLHYAKLRCQGIIRRESSRNSEGRADGHEPVIDREGVGRDRQRE